MSKPTNPAVLALYEEISRAKKRAAERRKADEEQKSAQHGVIKEGDRIVLKLPLPPPKPLPEDCCNSGCTPCINDTYSEAMRAYGSEVDALKTEYQMALRGETPILSQQRRTGLQPGYLDPLRFTTIHILSVQQVNRYSRLFVLDATASDFLLAVGEHIHVRAVIGNAKLTRPFTPVMIEAADGIVRPHMFIRLYDCHGMSTHFSRLSAGSSLSIRGPVPTSENITRAFSGKVCVLVAGGSGIAPIFQLLQFAHVNSSYHDRQIILAQCARDHTGVWLAKEISQFASEMAGLSYHVFLSQETHTGDSIALPVHVTCKRMGLESLRLLVPGDVANGHAVVCGPGTFNQDISSWLDRLGMEDIQVL